MLKQDFDKFQNIASPTKISRFGIMINDFGNEK